jgi:hypothetical protein
MGSVKRRLRNRGTDLIFRSVFRQLSRNVTKTSDRRNVLRYAAVCMDSLQRGLTALHK